MISSISCSALSFSIFAMISGDGPDELAQRPNVVGATDEAHRQVVEILLHREGRVGAVFVGDRGRGHVDARKIQSLVTRYDPTVHHARDHAAIMHPGRSQFDETVVYEDSVSLMHVDRDALIRHRHIVGGRVALEAQHERFAAPDGARRRHRPDADPRSLQIAENRHRAPASSGEPAHQCDEPRMLLMRAVREVDARHAQASVHQAPVIMSAVADAGPSVQTIFVR